MKAIVYHDRGDIRYTENYPEPQIAHSSEVKLKVHYTGICGSDLKEYTDGPIFFKKDGHEISGMDLSIGLVLGHEISAEVIEVGADVTDFQVGDKVVVEVTGTCLDKDRFPDSPRRDELNCEACQLGHYNACDYLGLTGLGFHNGGLAEYLVTSDTKLIKIDESKIPMDVAALIQPIAVSWHAVKVSRLDEGDSALILGGGPIGLATIFALKGHKAGKIVVSEPSAIRRELASSLGVEVFDPTDKTTDECVEKLKEMSPTGYGFNRSFDCSGVPATFETSFKALTVRGVATNVGIFTKKEVSYEPMHVTFSEKLVTGSICFVKSDFEECVAAFEAGLIPIKEVQSLISSKIKLKDGVKLGFDELVNHKEKHVKILFSP